MDSSESSPWSSVPRLIHLAQTYRASGNLRSALQTLEDGLAQEPDNADLLLLYARTLIDGNDIDRAHQALRAAQTINPEDPNSHIVMALIHLHRGEAGQAQSVCDHALTLDPELADAHYIRALVLASYHQTDQAEAALNRAMKLEPGNSGIAVELARVRFERGDLAEAAETLALVDEVGQTHPAYIMMMGEIAFREGRFDEARDRALWVLQEDADDEEAVRLLCEVNFAQSGVAGWPFRLSFWFDRLQKWLRISLITTAAFVFVVCATLWQAGARDTPILVALLTLLAIAAFALTRPYIFKALANRELRDVRLKEF